MVRMLQEIQGVSADMPGVTRRWFHNDEFDLFVTLDREQTLVGFELCYGSPSSEQALVWTQSDGYFHDGMRSTPRQERALAGLLEGDALDSDSLRARFQAASLSLPDSLKTALYARLQDYAIRAPDIPSRRKRFRRAGWQHRGTQRN